MSGPEPQSVVARAPGRVNLIGEHVDYAGGTVLPVAIEESVVVSATARPEAGLELRSDAYPGTAVVPPAADPARVEPAWAQIPAAVVAGLRDAGLPAVGFTAEFTSDLPPGGGLASSAAVAVATALAATALAGASRKLRDRVRLAKICRDAEVRATGVRCGLMDPFCALFAEEDSALMLDCATERHEAIGIDPDRIAFVLADSGVRHDLAASAYNERREEWERAVSLLPGVEGLGDLPLEGLAERTRDLPDPLPARVRHVVTENLRTVEATAMLRTGEAEEFGRLLDESHVSLSEDYHVSCPELDALAARARTLPGVLGARMTGGGFGGFVVAAVRPESAEEIASALSGRIIVPSGGAWAAAARRKDG